MKRNIARNQDVIWREEDGARQDVIGALGRGEDASGEGTVLLVVSGMMHQLNILGGEIWKLLDGKVDEAAVADRLQDMFDVDRETLDTDVSAFLDDLGKRGWISYDE